MFFPIVLAHGALGPFDELIMGGAAAIFLILMAVSWVRSRTSRPSFDQNREEENPRESTEMADGADHFRLD